MGAERGPSGAGTAVMTRGSEGGRSLSIGRSVISGARGEIRSFSPSHLKGEGARLRTLSEFKPSSANPDRQIKSFNIRNTKPWGETPSRSPKSEGGKSVIAYRSEAISSTRLPRRFAPRNDGGRQRTMSRTDFEATYRPFTPDFSQNSYLDSSRKTQQLITRQFSTYRDGATMHRSAIDRTKREISTTIDIKKPQSLTGETRRSIPKMRLYELRERPKVSLIKPVSLEKRNKNHSPNRLEAGFKPATAKNGLTTEGPKVSLVKKVNLEKRNNERRAEKISLIKKVSLEKRNKQQKDTSTVSLFKRVSLEKQNSWIPAFAGMTNEKIGKGEKTIQKRSIEQPSWLAEKQAKIKEQIIFLAETRWFVEDEKRTRIVYGSLDKIFGKDKKLILNKIELIKTDIAQQKKKQRGETKEDKTENEKKQQEIFVMKRKEDEEWSEPQCCNHHCELKDRKNGIGTCPRSGMLFTYDEFAKEKAARENRPVRRSDWNVKNTFVSAIKSTFQATPQGLTH